MTLIDNREDLIDFQQWLHKLLPTDADYVVVAVGIHGPNIDCPAGNAVATVRMGHDEHTSEALYLPDAIALARGAILRKREAEKNERRKKKEIRHDAD